MFIQASANKRIGQKHNLKENPIHSHMCHIEPVLCVYITNFIKIELHFWRHSPPIYTSTIRLLTCGSYRLHSVCHHHVLYNMTHTHRGREKAVMIFDLLFSYVYSGINHVVFVLKLFIKINLPRNCTILNVMKDRIVSSLCESYNLNYLFLVKIFFVFIKIATKT